jgi:hypothetical protein
VQAQKGSGRCRGAEVQKCRGAGAEVQRCRDAGAEVQVQRCRCRCRGAGAGAEGHAGARCMVHGACADVHV